MKLEDKVGIDKSLNKFKKGQIGISILGLYAIDC